MIQQGSICTAPDRRTRKRLATRQSISDTATRLFFERGFDHVTIDEIAEAADVGRMTVFNHFPRKEDMFFDREQEIHDVAFEAVRKRGIGITPVEASRLLAHRLIEQKHPLIPLFDGTRRFVETVMASGTLKARAREMRDDFIRALAAVLAEAVKRSAGDPHAHLAAGLIASTWSVAFAEAQKVFEHTGNAGEAKRTFRALIDRGTAGTAAALAGTAYA
jgi:AcrR family transcriptional regulator